MNIETHDDKISQKKHWDGKSYGTVLGYRIFYFFIKIFGIRAAYFFLLWVALYYILRIKRIHRKAIQSFKSKYNQWDQRKKKLGFFYIFENIYFFGKILVDRIALFLMNEKIYTVKKEGFENLQEIAKTGGILLSAHIGNWEMGHTFLREVHDLKCSIAMLVVSDPLQKIIQKDNLSVISLSSQQDVPFQIKNKLESGSLILMHGDRFLEGMNTIQVDFMGHLAHFPTGPYYTAAILEKCISFASIMKSGTKSYHFLCTKPKKYQWDLSRPKAEQVREWVEEYARFLEEHLKEHPEQWFNFYDFWDNKA